LTENSAADHIKLLPLAYPLTGNSAFYRNQPEHFQVTEKLNFQLSGSGDHLYLFIEKNNTNTDWLAKELARKSGLKPVDVGYAGRKDRFAVTRQWFSLHLPQSKSVDLTIFQSNDYKILEHSRHTKKLRKGEIESNHFQLQLINFKGDFESFQSRVKLLANKGFPNYFGPQRFGHEGANIDKARDMLSGKYRVKDRNKRSIYLSAARSFLFNLILAKRIEQNCWQSAIDGDQLLEQGNDLMIVTESITEELRQQLLEGKLLITGPLPGDGQSTVTADSLKLEQAVLASHESLYEGIANSRIQWQRRPLKAMPGNVSSEQNEHGILIEFSLSTGCYATSLLRELVAIDNLD